MARHSFQPRNSLFPCFSLYFPTLRALLREIPTHYFLRAPLFALREGFSDSCFPFSPIFLTFIFQQQSFRPHSPHLLHSLPHFLSLSSPLFHPPPQLTHDRAHPRALRAYAYARTPPHVKRFSFIAFTASPTLRNQLCTNALGVKKNEKKLSQNTQLSQNQHLTTNIRFHPP